MGAVPFQEAKWSRLGKRVMSPTSTRRRAAPEGSDAVQVHQAGACRSEQLLELLVSFLGALVDPFEVSDKLGCQASAGRADHVAGSHGREQCLGLGSGQGLLCPAWDQPQQQLVELGDHPRVVLT